MLTAGKHALCHARLLSGLEAVVEQDLLGRI